MTDFATSLPAIAIHRHRHLPSRHLRRIGITSLGFAVADPVLPLSLSLCCTLFVLSLWYLPPCLGPCNTNNHNPNHTGSQVWHCYSEQGLVWFDPLVLQTCISVLSCPRRLTHPCTPTAPTLTLPPQSVRPAGRLMAAGVCLARPKLVNAFTMALLGSHTKPDVGHGQGLDPGFVYTALVHTTLDDHLLPHATQDFSIVQTNGIQRELDLWSPYCPSDLCLTCTSGFASSHVLAQTDGAITTPIGPKSRMHRYRASLEVWCI